MSRRTLFIIVLLIFHAFMFWGIYKAWAVKPVPSRQATVLRVSDGDTIRVRVDGQEIKVRLYGIDAPESKQPGGPEATEFLRDLLLTETVSITTHDVDRYGREVATVELRGQSVQEMLLERGHAWVYTKYCKIPQCAEWKEIEARARAQKVGLWGEVEPVEPWEWRKR